jgi:putative ABC transport system permease protein
VLRLLATFIAFVGIISTLTAIHIESIKESGILRATGITPRQGRYILFYQSAMIGVLSVLAALPLGYLLAYILAEVINVRSFGWSLQFGFSVYQAILIVVTAGIASVLGGIFPARKVLQTPLPQILRAE